MGCFKSVLIVFLIVSYSLCALSFLCEDFGEGIENFKEQCTDKFFLPTFYWREYSDNNFENPGSTNNKYVTQNRKSCAQTSLIDLEPNFFVAIYINVKNPVNSFLHYSVLYPNNTIFKSETKNLQEVYDWVPIQIDNLSPNDKIKVNFYIFKKNFKYDGKCV